MSDNAITKMYMIKIKIIITQMMFSQIQIWKLSITRCEENNRQCCLKHRHIHIISRDKVIFERMCI